MSKKRLDLSHALAPLENELQDTLAQLCKLKEEDSPLFDAAIDAFIHKYGSSGYTSLEELLNSSAAQASYMQEETIPLSELLEDLLS